MAEKDKLADRLSKAHGDHAKEVVMCVPPRAYQHLQPLCALAIRMRGCCRLKSKAELATHEAASLRKQLREKALECEALQAAGFDLQSAMSDLKSQVRATIVGRVAFPAIHSVFDCVSPR